MPVMVLLLLLLLVSIFNEKKIKDIKWSNHCSLQYYFYIRDVNDRVIDQLEFAIFYFYMVNNKKSIFFITIIDDNNKKRVKYI